MTQPTISICMATYNGEKFLREQLDSIISQSYQDWQLLIRDDGSDDNTISIVEEYASRLPAKMRLIKDDNNHLGASLNFGKLLEQTDTEYIMFSDQDDIWLPNKVELTLNAMKNAEKINPDKPILIHTDLKVIDSQLRTIANSLWNYQKLFPETGDNLNKIMAHNVVTGCTVMINDAAKAVSIPIPPEAIMYDWWLALNVCRNGKIVHLPIQPILYRQHTDNQIGAKKAQAINLTLFLKKLRQVRNRLLTQYRMLKKFDPHTGFWSMILNKTSVKIAQRCR